jgi:hypothetical protein
MRQREWRDNKGNFFARPKVSARVDSFAGTDVSNAGARVVPACSVSEVLSHRCASLFALRYWGAATAERIARRARASAACRFCPFRVLGNAVGQDPEDGVDAVVVGASQGRFVVMIVAVLQSRGEVLSDAAREDGLHRVLLILDA